MKPSPMPQPPSVSQTSMEIISIIDNSSRELLHSPLNSTGASIWLKVPKVIYFNDRKCKIFNTTIYNKFSSYCQINAKRMPKVSVIAKLANLMPDSRNNAKQVQNGQKKSDHQVPFKFQI